MIVSFSSFSLLATPVEMAASFARKKKQKTKETKEKKKKTMRMAQVKMYRNTVHNKPQASQTQFIRMGDYKLSICEVTEIQQLPRGICRVKMA